MLVYVTANASDYSPVSWISEHPLSPFTDYSSHGTLPHVSLLGSFSLQNLDASLFDEVWTSSRIGNVTTLYPEEGSGTDDSQWSREVDSVTSIILTLSDENLSTSWVRVNDTDVAPRRQI